MTGDGEDDLVGAFQERQCAGGQEKFDIQVNGVTFRISSDRQ